MNDFVQYIVSDALKDVVDVTVKRMFGGHGLFKNGLMFGLIADDQLFFKVNEDTKQRYEEVGSEPFRYERSGKTIALSYWEVPADVLENHGEIARWANEAYVVARNAQ